MKEYHFMNVVDSLLDKGYSIYHFNDDEDIFQGSQGVFLRGEHPHNGIRLPCIIYIPEESMDYHAIHAIKNSPVGTPERLYAIEREYASFAYDGEVEKLERKIVDARNNPKTIFSHLSGSKIKRIAWATDIHLNFLEAEPLETFFSKICNSDIDALLLTGDIAESKDVCYYLDALEKKFRKPVYFVLGNHDFYGSSIEKVHQKCSHLCRNSQHLFWLTKCNALEITPEVALVGHDGWADGQHGDFLGSNIVMNDYVLIEDLLVHDMKRDFSSRKYKEILLQKLIGISRRTADHFRRILPEALKEYKHLILLTHIPPFISATVYNGRISTQDWLPHMSSHLVGETLVEIMSHYPDRFLTVLCGHTHGIGACRIQQNISAFTGEAQYGMPKIQQIFEIPYGPGWAF